LKYLLDTNVVSELRHRTPDQNVLLWRTGVSSVELSISVLTIGEIRKGIERVRSKDSLQAKVFEDWLESLIKNFGDRILPVTSAVAEVWGRLGSIRPMPYADSLMLATAKVNGLMFVSREADRYAGMGVWTRNPWK
jgi:predicted nucleic acid-binding protein